MRTSRVQSITNSVFRNSRQYLQTNERVFRLLDEGEEHRQRSGQHHHGKENNKGKTPQKPSASKKLIRKNGKGMIVKGIQSDANSMADLHNSLLKNTSKLNHAKKKSQLRTYRSSI